MRRQRVSRRIITASVLAGIAFLLMFLIYLVYIRPVQIARVAYAQDWTARMLINYMSEHDLRWPGNWSDLKSAHASVSLELGGIQSLDEIADVVVVDFGFDPNSVSSRNDSAVGVTIIKPKSGSSYYWEEPNQMIISWIRRSVATQRPQGEDTSALQGSLK